MLCLGLKLSVKVFSGEISNQLKVQRLLCRSFVRKAGYQLIKVEESILGSYLIFLGMSSVVRFLIN